MAATIRFIEASIEEYLHDPDGPVGKMLGEIGEEMTRVAEARVPYMKPENYSRSLRKSTQYMPWLGGWTASTIWYHPPANDSKGRLFAGTNAWYGPTVWLERGRKGRPMGLNRFMTDALDAATI